MKYKINVYSKSFDEYRWALTFEVKKDQKNYEYHNIVNGVYLIKANCDYVVVESVVEDLVLMNLGIPFIMRQRLVEVKGLAIEVLEKE